MVEGEVSTCVNLSAADLHAIEALCAIEKIDQTQLLKELVEDGLQERAIRLYEASKISSGKAAEILGVPLREFMEMLDKRLVPFNWDSESIKEYLKGIPEDRQSKKPKIFKFTPKHCPNCGSANIHNQPLESPFDTSELYDTYCRDCEWSGDISPDLPFSKGEDAKQKRKKTRNNYGINHEDSKRNNSNP